MASKQVIRVRSNKTQTQLDDQLLEGSAALKYEQVERLKDFLSGLQGGADKAVLELAVDQDSAQGTITVSSSGEQAVVIAGKILEGGEDYEIENLTAAEIAENLADVINAGADPELLLVTAEADDDEVTITARDPGLVGNFIPLSGSGEIAVSGSTLEGGTSGELRILSMNLVL